MLFPLQERSGLNGDETPLTFAFPTPVKADTFKITVTPDQQGTPVSVSKLQVEACVKPKESKWIVLKVYTS